MKIVLISLLTSSMLLSGCSVVSTASSALGASVAAYCTVPQTTRVLNRAVVEQSVEPHSIQITCKGDL